MNLKLTRDLLTGTDEEAEEVVIKSNELSDEAETEAVSRDPSILTENNTIRNEDSIRIRNQSHNTTSKMIKCELHVDRVHSAFKAPSFESKVLEA